MASLKKLGIERSYDPTRLEELHYSISIQPDRLKNPEQARKYLTKIINVVSEDALQKGGLDHLTLSVDGEYHSKLLSATKDLVSKATEHIELRNDADNWPALSKASVYGGLIVGGLAGLIFGYDQTTKWATNAAEYMNNASHLWAPITGLVQTGISVLGTATITVVGAIFGAVGGIIVSFPYTNAKTPLANRVTRYESIEQALSQAETNQKKHSGF